MRRVLIIAAGVLALGNVAAIAQPAVSRQDASGSQVSDPGPYGLYGGLGPAEYFQQHPDRLLPRDIETTGATDGSVSRLPPVPNASGSEVTNPDMNR
jgi:hypothetical protein